MQTQFQLGSYIHEWTNETHSPANLQELIPSYFGRYNYRQHKLTKTFRMSYMQTKLQIASFVVFALVSS